MIGLLNINKPRGLTSREVVNRIQRRIRRLKVGHAGTLDPLASGVLVLCVGKATRLITRVQDLPKTYRGTFELGKTSESDDLESEAISTGKLSDISQDQLEALLPSLTGEVEQVPPRFSAVHIDGKRAYELAREGKKVELESRTVSIHSLRVIAWDFPHFSLEIVCGSGTYIRSIGRDLGEMLGCGAVMTGLIRTAIGNFDLESALGLEQLEEQRIEDLLLPPGTAVTGLPRVECSAPQIAKLTAGQGIDAVESFDEDREIAVYHRADLICLARYSAGKLWPKLVLAER